MVASDAEYHSGWKCDEKGDRQCVIKAVPHFVDDRRMRRQIMRADTISAADETVRLIMSRRRMFRVIAEYAIESAATLVKRIEVVK